MTSTGTTGWTRMVRAWLVAGALVVFLGACGGEEEDPCAEVSCPEGAVCINGSCVDGGGGECSPACGDGELCSGGRCVSAGGGCDYHGQSCASDRFGAYLDGHLCMDWTVQTGAEAVCSQDCRASSCPQGSGCFLINLQPAQACTGDDGCGEGQFCYQGACAFASCRPSDCELPDGPDDACGSGLRCAEVLPAVNYCVPAGPREVGESCLPAGQAFQEGRTEEVCAEDGACVSGVCRAYCASDGSCSGAGEICSELSGRPGVEVCAVTCTPGEPDACGGDETCIPSGEGGGICQEAGTTPAFEACTVGGEACEAGTICVEAEGGRAVGRCLPVCDLSAGPSNPDGPLSRQSQLARDQTCPEVELAQGSFAVWHLADALGSLDFYEGSQTSPVATAAPGGLAQGQEEAFLRRDQGRVTWALRQAGDPVSEVPVADGEFDLSPGEVQLLLVMPEAGRDQGVETAVVTLAPGEGSVQWVLAIPDLGSVDLWAGTGDDLELVIDDWAPGEVRGEEAPQGAVDLVFRPADAGDDGEELLRFEAVEFGEESMVAFRGTMDGSDLHVVAPPVFSAEEIPDLQAEAQLPWSCRAVNDGGVGACFQRCDGGTGLQTGMCQGEGMGCGPRLHNERNRWGSVCQPVGNLAEGDQCSPVADHPCGEGLFCEAYGAVDGQPAAGTCRSLCVEGQEGACPDERGCRPIAAGTEYVVGECRQECVPDGGYTDPSCPEGLASCKPEAALIPLGDGVSGGFSVHEEQPFCWASGSAEVGEACSTGSCMPGAECLYERSLQFDFVTTLLSPYFGGGGLPRCRPICDPFSGTLSDHTCEEDETCLFNYPWNASVGHCAEIVESREIGEPCDNPGLACGVDSICVINMSDPECMRFCQFTGSSSTGYTQSTCPSGYQCAPLVRDIGVCQAAD